MTYGGSGATYRPALGDGALINQFLPLSRWWNQIFIVLAGKISPTRKSTVLAAVNKDGEAHVDAKLTK